ncbi:hypothetical protein Ciccas_000530 [Cichlidogyrus casuarinus]|uniref:Uncharacterized protein n=1 Tax=Cichlidogyrus casuarinus TaxID=1844966 RepID=A0ABD2QML7_9PLAT
MIFDEADFTIVIETMNPEESKCLYDGDHIKPWNVTGPPSIINLKLEGDKLAKFDAFYVWITTIDIKNETQSQFFEYKGRFELANHELGIALSKNMLVTLSTRNTSLAQQDARELLENQQKSDSQAETVPLPLPYKTDFELDHRYGLTEPEYLTPQFGYFEKSPDPLWSGRTVLVQRVEEPPIAWCAGNHPIALMGYGKDWADAVVETSAAILGDARAEAIFVGARIESGGCKGMNTNGLFFWLNFKSNIIEVSTSLDKVTLLASRNWKLESDRYYDISLWLKGQKGVFRIDGETLLELNNITSVSAPGFVGIGSYAFGKSAFRFFSISLAN